MQKLFLSKYHQIYYLNLNRVAKNQYTSHIKVVLSSQNLRSLQEFVPCKTLFWTNYPCPCLFYYYYNILIILLFSDFKICLFQEYCKKTFITEKIYVSNQYFCSG